MARIITYLVTINLAGVAFIGATGWTPPRLTIALSILGY
jgi:hypothetical protein